MNLPGVNVFFAENINKTVYLDYNINKHCNSQYTVTNFFTVEFQSIIESFHFTRTIFCIVHSLIFFIEIMRTFRENADNVASPSKSVFADKVDQSNEQFVYSLFLNCKHVD